MSERRTGPSMSVDAAGLANLGLYDPGPHAQQQLELLEFLIGLGATAEDLIAYRHELPGLASVLALRDGTALTSAEVAERSGLSENKVRRINRAAGFPEPGPRDRVFTQRFADAFGRIAAAETVFGEEPVLQLIRVMGASMARVADACVSAFLVNVEPAARDEDPVGLGVARANAEVAALVPGIAPALDVLLRQHIVSSRRTVLGDVADSGYETQRLCVGFVDLVGSTTLAQRLSTRELGALFTEFENTAADTVTAGGGRVVKLIGDEVLYTAGVERSGCAIAFELVRTFRDHARLPKVRVGIACGDVLVRDGDVFGPVVTLAARAVNAAGPGEIVAPTGLAGTGMVTQSLGQHAFKGFDEPVELCRLVEAEA